jgi:hypothetical protein
MATLYASANTARKVLIFFLIFAVIVLIWDNIGKFAIENPNTGEDTRFFMKADRAFGATLPEFKLESVPINTSTKPTFVRESTHSATFPDVAYVYKILQPRENFQFLSTFEDTARSLGFDTDPSVTGNDYSWKGENNTKTLKYNSISQVWSLDTDLTANADAKVGRLTLQTAANYESRIQTVLRNAEFDSKGYEDPVFSAKFLDLNSDGELVSIDDPANAEYGFGTAYRFLDLADLKPTGERPELKKGQVLPAPMDGKVYTNDPRKGSFSLLYSYNLGNMKKDLYELDFINFEYTQVGSYQIITPDEGFSSIQNGKGALVSLTQPNMDYFEDLENATVTSFSIQARRTELAFYEPQEWVGYTYPIYVYYATAELSNGSLANAIFFIDAVKRVD